MQIKVPIQGHLSHNFSEVFESKANEFIKKIEKGILETLEILNKIKIVDWSISIKLVFMSLVFSVTLYAALQNGTHSVLL